MSPGPAPPRAPSAVMPPSRWDGRARSYTGCTPRRRDVQLVGGDPVGERQVHQLHRRRAGHPHPAPLPPAVPLRGRRRRPGRPAQRPGADHLGQGGRGVPTDGQDAADGVRRARAAAQGLRRGAGRRATPQRRPRAHRRGQEGVAHQGPAQGALQSGRDRARLREERRRLPEHPD